MKNQIVKTQQALVLQEKEQLIAEAKLLIKHKPSLVKAIDQKKIREYSPEEQEQGNGTLITWILSLLGITHSDENDRSLHYVAVDMFITEELSGYSYEEIKEAFKMYVKGVFSKDFDKVIYKLDCVIVAKVMSCYDKEKIRITKTYNEQLKRKILELEEEKNKLSDDDKFKIVLKGLEESFEEYKEKGVFDQTGRLYLYHFLFERDLLPKDKKTKDAVLKKAKKKIEAIQEVPITKKERDFNKALESDKNKATQVLNECYRISIERFFSKFITFEQLKKHIKK